MPKRAPQQKHQARLGNKNARTHGDYRTRLHNIWHGMLQRCEYEGHTKYWNYGGRGIRVCAGWHSFAVFRAWALDNGYAANLTLDRINPDRGYFPSNCRWVSYKTQNLNRRMWAERIPHPKEQ